MDIRGLDVRSGRAERLSWCNCLALDGAIEANVRVEEVLRAAKAVDALRRIALEGAIVRYVCGFGDGMGDGRFGGCSYKASKGAAGHGCHVLRYWSA